mmetsp:Transcript_587/g.113  ORF Transcript_587/g.113 Transcript_587/m.113 type:complete len:86 (+) Transcript_587:35-292(+)
MKTLVFLIALILLSYVNTSLKKHKAAAPAKPTIDSYTWECFENELINCKDTLFQPSDTAKLQGSLKAATVKTLAGVTLTSTFSQV